MNADIVDERVQANNPVQKKKPKKGKAMLIVLLVLLLLAAAAGAYNILAGRPFYALPLPEKTEKPKEIEYNFFGPDDYTVNLADSGQRRYLKVQITLAFEDGKLQDELTKKKAQVRDLVITILRSRTALDLENSEGMETLRSEIKAGLNAVLAQGQLAEVYFTDFLVQ